MDFTRTTYDYLIVRLITGLLVHVSIVSVNKCLDEKVCDGFVHKLSLSVVLLSETRPHHAQKWFVEMLQTSQLCVARYC